MSRATAAVTVAALCCAAATGCAGSSGRGAASDRSAVTSAAVGQFRRLAADNGERHPRNLRYVVTTAGAADRVTSGAADQAGEAAEPVILLVAQGRFDGGTIKHPPGYVSSGTVLTETALLSTARSIGWSISDTLPDLASLGPVVSAG
jgi:hypothetical protein